jgi:uncharacterized membrane protein YciS (DUF1049 family)
LANRWDVDFRYLAGMFLFLTVLRALFGFPFASGFAIGSFAMCIFALWEVGRKAQADRNAKRQDGATRLGPKDESPVP